MTITITSQLACAYLAGSLSAVTIGFCIYCVRKGIWGGLIIIAPSAFFHFALLMEAFR